MFIRQTRFKEKANSIILLAIELGFIVLAVIVIRLPSPLEEKIVIGIIFYFCLLFFFKFITPLGPEASLHDLFAFAEFDKTNGLIRFHGYRKKITINASSIKSWFLIKHFVDIESVYSARDFFDLNYIGYELRLELADGKMISYFLPHFIVWAVWSEKVKVANEQISKIISTLNIMLPNKQQPSVLVCKRDPLSALLSRRPAQKLPPCKNLVRII